MNPEPPPIADPHDTRAAPSQRVPLKPGTFLAGLIHVILGVPTVGAGLVLIGMVWERLASKQVGFVAMSVLALFIFALWGLGGALLVHGWRLWTRGR